MSDRQYPFHADSLSQCLVTIGVQYKLNELILKRMYIL